MFNKCFIFVLLLFLLGGDRFICVVINLPECHTAKRSLYFSFINNIYIYYGDSPLHLPLKTYT